jgi:outer membrane protein
MYHGLLPERFPNNPYTMKTILTILLSAILVGVSAGDLTAQSRIGVVNPQAILDALPETAVIDRRLREYRMELQNELENRAKSLQDNVSAYESRKTMMTEPQQREEQTRLGRLAQQVQQYERSIPQLAQRRQNELMQPILQEMNTLIERYATELKLDYVLNQQLALNQMPMFFLADASKTPYDLTPRILEQLKK